MYLLVLEVDGNVRKLQERKTTRERQVEVECRRDSFCLQVGNNIGLMEKYEK